MKYGQFIENGSQFVIDTPKTPYSWSNYYSLGWTRIDTGYKGIEASIRVFVPLEGI